MSDDIRFPRAPTPTIEGLQASVEDLQAIIQQLVFPTKGESILERIGALESTPTTVVNIGVGGISQDDADARYLRLIGGDLSGSLGIRTTARVGASLDVIGPAYLSQDSATAVDHLVIENTHTGAEADFSFRTSAGSLELRDRRAGARRISLAPDGSLVIDGPLFAPTPLAADNSTRVATTAWVRGYVAGGGGGGGGGGATTFASLESFGAVGDNVADDTAAMQAWLSAGGGMMPKPAVAYRVTDTLLVTVAGTLMLGVGDASLINFDIPAGSPAKPVIEVRSTATGAQLRNFKVDAKGAALIRPTIYVKAGAGGQGDIFAGSAILVQADSVVMDSVNVDRSWDNGIGVGRFTFNSGTGFWETVKGFPKWVKISNSHGYKCGEGSSLIVGVAGCFVDIGSGSETTVSDCTAYLCGVGFGADTGASANNRFVNCVASWPTKYGSGGGVGFYCGATQTVFTNCSVYSANGPYAWFLDGAGQDVRLIGCSSYGAQGNGLYIKTFRNAYIDGFLSERDCQRNDGVTDAIWVDSSAGAIANLTLVAPRVVGEPTGPMFHRYAANVTGANAVTAKIIDPDGLAAGTAGAVAPGKFNVAHDFSLAAYIKAQKIVGSASPFVVAGPNGDIGRFFEGTGTANTVYFKSSAAGGAVEIGTQGTTLADLTFVSGVGASTFRINGANVVGDGDNTNAVVTSAWVRNRITNWAASWTPVNFAVSGTLTASTISTSGGAIVFNTTTGKQAAIEDSGFADGYVAMKGGSAEASLFAWGGGANYSLVLGGKGAGTIKLSASPSSGVTGTEVATAAWVLAKSYAVTSDDLTVPALWTGGVSRALSQRLKAEPVMLSDALGTSYPCYRQDMPSLTVSGTAVTVTGNRFANAAVGMTIALPGCGTGGTTAHVTTIASKTDSNTITLTAAAPTACSAVARSVVFGIPCDTPLAQAVAEANARAGAKVILPIGNILLASTVNMAAWGPAIIEGQGPRASWVYSLAQDGIVCAPGSAQGSLSRFSLVSALGDLTWRAFGAGTGPVAGGSGVGITLQGMNQGSFARDLEIWNFQTGLVFKSSFEVIAHNVNVLNATTVGIQIGASGASAGAGNRLLYCRVGHNGHASEGQGIGLLMLSDGATECVGVTVLGTNQGIVVQPPAGGAVNKPRFVECSADTTLNEPWLIDGTAGNIIGGEMRGCLGTWSGGLGGASANPNGIYALGGASGIVTKGGVVRANSGTGTQVSGIEGWNMTECRFSENGRHGWHHQGGNLVTARGCRVYGNSKAVHNTYDGIRISYTTAVAWFSVDGNISGNYDLAYDITPQRYAFYIDGTGAPSGRVINNNFNLTNGTGAFARDGGIALTSIQFRGNLPATNATLNAQNGEVPGDLTVNGIATISKTAGGAAWADLDLFGGAAANARGWNITARGDTGDLVIRTLNDDRSGTVNRLTLDRSGGVTLGASPANGVTGNEVITAAWVIAKGYATSAGSMIWPGAGVPNSTGSAWATSYSNSNPLPVSIGGTGATTLTGYVKGSGTSALTTVAAIPVADVTGAAPLASPTFTGTPAAPTPASTDNGTTVATTAYAQPRSRKEYKAFIPYTHIAANKVLMCWSVSAAGSLVMGSAGSSAPSGWDMNVDTNPAATWGFKLQRSTGGAFSDLGLSISVSTGGAVTWTNPGGTVALSAGDRLRWYQTSAPSNTTTGDEVSACMTVLQV